MSSGLVLLLVCFVFFQAEDGIRDLVRSRGLGDVYKRQAENVVWQHFSGMRFYEPRLPCDATQIGRFRTAIGLSLIHL